MAAFNISDLKARLLRAPVLEPIKKIVRDVADSLYRVDTEELTATGAVTEGVQVVQLNHATVVIAATIADFTKHAGIFIVEDTSASGTAAHTLTLTGGTFDGTNTVATLDAPGERLVCVVDKDGNGRIIVNTGAVALSTP